MNKEERLREAKKKKAAASYCPTLEEVFITGWTNSRGTTKKAIKELKNSDLDKQRIAEVFTALNSNELGLDGMSTRDISKSTVLNVLYPRLVEIRKDKIIKQLIAHAPENYHLVTTIQDLLFMQDCILGETAIAVDTETTGLKHTDVIVGYSITCPTSNNHFYVPFRHQTGEKQLSAETALEAIKPVLENDKVVKILHNVKFDHEKFMFDPDVPIDMVNYYDTQVLMYVLNENEESYALKKLATKYGKHFGFEDKSDTYEELFGKGGFENTPIDVGYIYACKDTHLTWSLYQWQLEHLKKQPKLYHIAFDIEMPLLPVLIKMHYRGFRVDQEYAQQYLSELKQEIAEMEEKLTGYFPNINLNSNQQLAEYLYDVLKLPDNHKRSVDKDTLQELSEYEGVKLLLDYRKLTKLVSTYIEPLPQLVWDDGYLHGEFDQIGTKTLRMASRNPNMQNLDPKARRLFLAPEGKMYVSMDLSKMEVVLACEYSGDPDLYEALHSGADVYSALAAKSFNKPIEECGDGSIYRKHAKTALLGCMYGSSAFTMGKQLNISTEEAQETLNKFFEGYPVLAQAIERNHQLIATQGYVETLQGSKRRFPEIPKKVKMLKQIDAMIKQKTGKTGTQWEEELGSIWQAKRIPRDLKSKWYELKKDIARANRQSFNASVQGSGGLLSKLILIQMDKYFTELNNKLGRTEYYIVSQVHDELLLEMPLDTPYEVMKQCEYIMCNSMEMKCKLKTDVELYKRYYMGGISVNGFYVEGKRWSENGEIL